MKEVEVKIKISQDELEKIIKLIGEPKYSKQENIIYIFESGFLRIRKENRKNTLTYKGAREDNQKFNSREEIELYFDSFENAEKLFDLLNLKQKISYSKLRAIYNLKDCTLCLDKFYDDDYLEIEGNEKGIMSVLNILNLNKRKTEKRAYHELILEVMKGGEIKWT